jgi:hypothetical protein
MPLVCCLQFCTSENLVLVLAALQISSDTYAGQNLLQTCTADPCSPECLDDVSLLYKTASPERRSCTRHDLRTMR